MPVSTKNTGPLKIAEWLPNSFPVWPDNNAPIEVARPRVPHGMTTMPHRAILSPISRPNNPISKGTVAIRDTPKPVIDSSNGARPSTTKITCAEGDQPRSFTHSPIAFGAPSFSTKITKANPGTITLAMLRNNTEVSLVIAQAMASLRGSAHPVIHSASTKKTPSMAA